MSDRRYYPGYMNEEEYRREQIRQEDMVESITRGYSRAKEKEKALERLSHLLEVLEMIAQDLVETTKALKNYHSKTVIKSAESPPTCVRNQSD